MSVFLAENATDAKANGMWRWRVRRILVYAESNGLTNEHQITPAWVAGFPPQSQDLRRENLDRALFGRLLLKTGLWSQEKYGLCEMNLTASTAHSDADCGIGESRKPLPSPPDELCQLVKALAYRCALSMREVQQLRVMDIHPDGLRIRRAGAHRIPGRFIRFGFEPERLPKALLDDYRAAEHPTDFLFFSRSPRDKRKSISKQTLSASVAKLQRGSTIGSLRDQHFQEDFDRSTTPQEARSHFRNIHGLSNSYAHTLITGRKASAHLPNAGRPARVQREIKGFVTEAKTIPVAAPYLLAAMCASLSLQGARAMNNLGPRGGERRIITWSNFLDHEITANWPSGLLAELRGRGQRNVRVLRLLLHLAFDCWYEGRRMKLPDINESAIKKEDRDLLGQLAMITVAVRNLASPLRSWSGCLFEYGTRRASFRVPLIEDMNRHAWHNQCLVCWHPEREKIELEILQADTRETRVKGYHLIAERYGVSYISLARHSGRVAPPKGRGDKQRSHFSGGPAAPIVQLPRGFFEHIESLSATDLVLYLTLMIEKHHRGYSWLETSTELVEQWLGLGLDEHKLSLSLNHLGPSGSGLIKDFRRDRAKMFRIEL